ncbi:hypothetical protein ABPG74_007775 [Tetrahymena malaccensis]
MEENLQIDIQNERGHINYQYSTFQCLNQLLQDLNICFIELVKEIYKFCNNEEFQQNLEKFDINIAVPSNKLDYSPENFQKLSKQLNNIKNMLNWCFDLPDHFETPYCFKGFFTAILCLIDIVSKQTISILLRKQTYLTQNTVDLKKIVNAQIKKLEKIQSFYTTQPNSNITQIIQKFQFIDKTCQHIWIQTDQNLKKQQNLEQERKYQDNLIKNIQDISDQLTEIKLNHKK